LLSAKRFAFAALLFAFVCESAYAADIQTVLTNMSNIIMPLTAMVLMISYAAGVYMIIHALTMFKKFGNVSMQAQPGELSGPLMQLIVGAVLIYLPTSTDTLTNSLFGTTASIFGYGTDINFANAGTGSQILGYLPTNSFGQQWAAMANTLVLYIQFLGLLSFVKGWFILSKSAGHGAQPGMFAKGVTHVLGGIVAINFVGVVQIISNTIFGT
jgi:intracellular multiplication protein IcmC